MTQSEPHGDRRNPIDDADPPISISHIVHVLSEYTPAIFVAMAGIMSLYAIIAVAVLLLSPRQVITSLPFRLEFEGAAAGRYPNGLKFSASDIVTTPVILRVFNSNRLERFVTFPEFSRALVVLESNDAMRRLITEFESRLRDPKLTPVDRARIEQEFDAKRQSIAKNEYALTYVAAGKSRIPRGLVDKVLHEVLTTWAQYAATEQRILLYRVAVLGPSVIDINRVGSDDYVAAVHVLRSNVYLIFDNIRELRQMPGGEVARTRAGNLSLLDIETLLENIVRFRIEPLPPLLRSAGLVSDPAASVRYIEAQLAYDQRLLEARKEQAEAIRQALRAYSPATGLDETRAASVDESGRAASGSTGTDAVVPQLSENFIDRLLTLTRESNDIQYRQRLVNDLREATVDIIPVQQAVAYDRQLVEQLRSAAPPSRSASADEVRKLVLSAFADVRELAVKVNELHATISQNLNPTTELLTVTGTVGTRRESTVSLRDVVLWGVLTFLVSLLITVVACLLHNRMREEESVNA